MNHRLAPLLLLTLATTAAAGPTRAIEPAGVRALAVAYYDDGSATGAGATFPVEVRVRENTLGGPQVGVIESATGASGISWRASAFVATFVATSVLELSPSDVEVTVAVRGRIDGPSAGALLTSSLVAALTATPVNPNVTMSGTINPDGTIGPVGGLAAKVSAAAAAKQNRVGIPAGQLTPELAAQAKQLGVQLVELGSLRDAFKLLTGKTLPAPKPLPPAQMAVSAETHRRMTAAARELLSGLKPPAKVSTENDRLNLEAAREFAEKAEAWLHLGNPGAALDDATTAAALFESIRIRTRGNQPHLARIRSELAASEKQLQEAVSELSSRLPTTVAHWTHRVRTFGILARAHSMLLLARRDLEELATPPATPLPRDPQALLEQARRSAVQDATLVSGVASVNALALKAMLFEGAAPREGAPVALDLAKVGELTEWMVGMADTNLAYFDALLVEPIARERRMTLEEVRPLVEAADRGYALARAELRLAQRYMSGSGMERVYGLALAERAYVTAAQLIAREYALGATRDGAGRIIDVRGKAALAQMLEEAELAARIEAANARTAVAAVPADAALSYQAAVHYRAGSLDDQFQALREFWWSTVSSNVAVELQRATLSRSSLTGKGAP